MKIERVSKAASVKRIVKKAKTGISCIESFTKMNVVPQKNVTEIKRDSAVIFRFIMFLRLIADILTDFAIVSGK